MIHEKIKRKLKWLEKKNIPHGWGYTALNIKIEGGFAKLEPLIYVYNTNNELLKIKASTKHKKFKRKVKRFRDGR